MYERLLVPTDGSDCASAAVDHALDIAARYDAAVDALFVADVGRVGYGAPALNTDQVEAALLERGETVTEAVVERGRTRGVGVTPAVESGRPVDVICEFAGSNGVDLVVMGTHGRTGLDRHLVGSVAERTVRRSPVPVMTVRRGG